MADHKTSKTLLRALRQAARPMTADERHRQRVSFVMGSLKDDSRVTRAQVESILDDQSAGKRVN